MKKHLKKIIIGIAVAIAIGIGFLAVMFTEGSYIVYVPNKWLILDFDNLYHSHQRIGYTNYKAMFDKVMAIDPKIRFATIFDMDGNVLHSEHRKGVENLLSQDESKKSLQLAINAWKSRNEVSSKIGRGKYALVEYEKIKRITMPIDSDHILYITTDVEADHAPIIYHALRIRQDALHRPEGMP